MAEPSLDTGAARIVRQLFGVPEAEAEAFEERFNSYHGHVLRLDDDGELHTADDVIRLTRTPSDAYLVTLMNRAAREKHAIDPTIQTIELPYPEWADIMLRIANSRKK